MDYFLEEILSQPRVIRATLDRYLEDECLLRSVSRVMEQGRYQLILLTGMGSSYFALYSACVYLNEHGLSATMVEASELLHYYKGLISDRVLVVIASQSGETVEVQKLLGEVGGRTLIMSLTNDAENYVARNSGLPLFLYAGQESGPASKTHTATISVMLLLAMYLTSTMNKQRVERLYAAVEAMESFLERWREKIDAMFDFLGKVDCLSLLGRGPSVASAMAGALILKEAAKMRAEGMSAGQFRHGPLEAVSPDLAAIVFAMKGRTRDINLRLAHDIAEFGGKVVIIGSDEGLQGERIFNLTLPLLDEFSSPLLEIVPIQLLSWRIATEKGLRPGKFDKAKKVTLYE
ncbi:MAG: SIS domain-containing protein [Anaerolineae bacterium]|nr:SIS domain-containing protein [Anaerolineae bacterium]